MKNLLILISIVACTTVFANEWAVFTPKLIFGKTFDNWGSFSTFQADEDDHHDGVFVHTDGTKDFFIFNDSENDFQTLRTNRYGDKFLDEKTISLLTDAEIDECLSEAITPTMDMNLREKLLYTFKESMSDGELDFSSGADGCGIPLGADFYLIHGIAYNKYDYGNYMWGSALKKMGIPYLYVKTGSELNAVFNTYKQNGDIDPPWHRLSLTGDSENDQKAIRRGYLNH